VHRDENEERLPGWSRLEVVRHEPADRVADLEREVRELREANEVLRAVAGYFAATPVVPPRDPHRLDDEE
jgi:hypothetical protein